MVARTVVIADRPDGSRVVIVRSGAGDELIHRPIGSGPRAVRRVGVQVWAGIALDRLLDGRSPMTKTFEDR